MKKILLMTSFISIAALIIFMLVAGAFTQPSRYEGKTVTAVFFHGLNKTKEKDLVDIMLTKKGVPLSFKDIENDRKYITGFGRFRSVEVKYSETKDGIQLNIHCVEDDSGKTVQENYEGLKVKKIHVSGINFLTPGDLTRIMSTKAGQPFKNTDFEKDKMEILKIVKIDRLKTWFEKDKDGVIIYISCREKPFVFLNPEKYEGKIVKERKLYGLINLSQNDIYDQMRTTEGHPLRAVEIRDDIENIFNENKLYNIEILIEEFKDGVRLLIFCKEGQRIESVEFKGMEEFQSVDISELLALKEGQIFRRDYLEKSLKSMKDKYNSEGMFNSIISYNIIPNEDENTIKVQFIVDEGEEIKVQKISIMGARNIDYRDLAELMETKEASMFYDGAFKKDVYEQDKSKIIAYYKERGYLDAQIVEDMFEYEWENPVKQDKRAIFIIMKISEGEKYYFDGYSINISGKDGKTVFTKEEFFRDFELQEKGGVFNDLKFSQDKQTIGFKYASKGYIFAKIIPKKTVTEREVQVKGKMEKRKFVFHDISITEGEIAYIERILIKGNKKTKDKVIRREIIINENELFDARKVQISRQNISNLGFFKQVNFDFKPGSTESFVNMVVDVEEQPSGTISLGGGYGTNSGFSIFADLAENNLYGNGQRVGIKFEYGPLRRSVTLSFYEKWLFDIPLGFEFSVYYRMYENKNEPSVFPKNDATAQYETQIVGYTADFGYRFWNYFTLGFAWDHQFKNYLNPSGNSADEIFMAVSRGIQEKRTVSYYLSFNTRDNNFNPTSGVLCGLTVGLTGGTMLGGDDHYIRYTPKLNFYLSPFHLPFLKTHPVVFEFRASGTFLGQPLNSRQLEKSKPFEKNPWIEAEDRMSMGGPETIRGWDYTDNRLPESWTSVKLFDRILYGVELRVPIHPQMLWLALFFDAGSLWTDKKWEKQLTQDYRDIIDQDKTNKNVYDIREALNNKVDLMSYFRYSYGFGFRIQIPMMPLRFWFGRKMLYQEGTFKTISDYNFQFSIGDMRW